MELVYLWVEDYKNIKKQGFNFSPRFECKFDDETKELTINEKKDYVSIFPENINVTAIVGENGSGKSSIQKLILLILYYFQFKDTTKEEDEEIYSRVELIKELHCTNMFLIFKPVDNICQTITFNIELEPSSKYEAIDEINTFTFYLNYMLDTLYDNSHDSWLHDIYHKTDDYGTPLLIQPNKSDGYEHTVHIDNIDSLINKRILENKGYATSIFSPNKCQIYMYTNFQNIFKYDNKKMAHYTLLNKLTRILNDCNFSSTDYDEIDKILEPFLENFDFEFCNLLYIYLKISRLDDTFDKEHLNLEYEGTGSLSKEALQRIDFTEVVNNFDYPEYKLKKIEEALEFHKESVYSNTNLITFLNGEKLDLSSMEEFYINLPSWIDIIFYDCNKSFKSLSSGEKLLFRLIIDITYQIKKIKEYYNGITICLDETELGLHPQWQKAYLKHILESIKIYVQNDFVINILFVTHSPFILSDLPKENVIFLKDGKQEYPFKDKQTFGANIHTLLSHGFFMDGGLMGEFAKGKINDIKVFYEKVNKSSNQIVDFQKEYNSNIKNFKHIQKIIGEAFLQTIIKNYLDELEQIFDNQNYSLRQREKLLGNFTKKRTTRISG